MKDIIYIQLLGEGTIVYRPVPAIQITKDIYEVGGDDLYDPYDEEWEYSPGAVVEVEQRVLEGEKVLIAVRRHQQNDSPT